jgi:hypothetical protein
MSDPSIPEEFHHVYWQADRMVMELKAAMDKERFKVVHELATDKELPDNEENPNGD